MSVFSIPRLEKFYQSSQYDFSSGRYSGESAGVRLWRLVRWHPTVFDKGCIQQYIYLQAQVGQQKSSGLWRNKLTSMLNTITVCSTLSVIMSQWYSYFYFVTWKWEPRTTSRCSQQTAIHELKIPNIQLQFKPIEHHYEIITSMFHVNHHWYPCCSLLIPCKEFTNLFQTLCLNDNKCIVDIDRTCI